MVVQNIVSCHSIVRFYHIKVLCGATDKTFSMILDFLKDVFPHGKPPSSFYESKKMIRKLGFSYDKIDACQTIVYYIGVHERIRLEINARSVLLPGICQMK